MSVLSDITGASGVVEAITGFVGKFFPDKTQEEKDAAAQALQKLIGEQADSAAQTAIDLAESQSPDRINHWRGGLGWACTLGVAWHFFGLPVFGYIGALVVAAVQAFNYKAVLPTPPDLSDASLSALCQVILIMLGSHAVPAVTGIFKKS